LEFETSSAAVKFDIVPEQRSRLAGQLIVALFGDERPLTAPAGPRVGRGLMRVDPVDWSDNRLPVEGLKRPIDVRFDQDGSPFVVDFGEFEITPNKGLHAVAGSGRVLQLKPDELGA
jgi:hypothetical protein